MSPTQPAAGRPPPPAPAPPPARRPPGPAAAALEDGLGCRDATALREHGHLRAGRRRRAHRPTLACSTRRAFGSAASRAVFGLSFALMLGSIPSPARFSPLGRK